MMKRYNTHEKAFKQNQVLNVPVLYGRSKLCKTEFSPDGWWQRQAVTIALVVLLSLVDAGSLYSLFDRWLTESPLLLGLVTGGVALCLNFIPLLLAHYIAYHHYHIEQVPRWKFALIILAFFVVFGATVFLRFTTPTVNAATDTGGFTSLNVGDETLFDASPLNAQSELAFTLLLSVVPFVTSVINLFLGLVNSNPIKAAIVRLSKVKNMLHSNMDEYEAALEEAMALESYEQDLLDYERALFEGEQEDIDAWQQTLKDQVRVRLAIALPPMLKTPSAISELTATP